MSQTRTPKSLRSIPILPYYYTHGWRLIILVFGLVLLRDLCRPVFRSIERWCVSNLPPLVCSVLVYLFLVVLLPPIFFLFAYPLGLKPLIREEDWPENRLPDFTRSADGPE